MGKIFSFINNLIFGKIDGDPRQGRLVLARRVRELLDKCPACSLSFRSHKLCTIAGTIYTDQNRARCEELREDLRSGKFDEVLSFDEFDPFEDALLVGIIKCPSKQAVWLLICAPYEPYLKPAIMEFSVISADESPSLLGLVDEDSWVEFEG